MKKITLFLPITLILSGCFLSLPFKTDNEISLESITALTSAIANKESLNVKNLFSVGQISEIENFDNDIKLLEQYFTGSVTNIKKSALSAENGLDGDWKEKYISASYEVKTTDDDYRLALKLCAIDTKYKENIGIWSLYVIKESKITYPEYAYWGDGKDKPGINIEVLWDGPNS